MIKVGESQKALDLFELDWCKSISDGGNLLRVYADIIDTNKKAQIKNFLNLKHIFLNVHIKSEFLQADQN